MEWITHYGTGMPIGKSTIWTIFWLGRFSRLAEEKCGTLIPRKTIVAHLCGSVRGKDPHVRQALIDRFGGDTAIGRKKTPGPLYGIHTHVWSALAVAVAWWELSPLQPPAKVWDDGVPT